MSPILVHLTFVRHRVHGEGNDERQKLCRSPGEVGKLGGTVTNSEAQAQEVMEIIDRVVAQKM